MWQDILEKADRSKQKYFASPCLSLFFFFLLLLTSARKWRGIIFKPVFLPDPAWLASWGSLAGSSARWAPAQSLCWLPSSSAAPPARHFSKLFAQTYNNIIFSHLQSHHGAKSLQVPALKSSCSLAAEQLRLTLSPEPVKWFTSHSLKYFAKMLF